MRRNAFVGVFVLTGVALFTSGLFIIGNRHNLFAQHLVVYTDFVNLSGLAKGSKVQVAGMDAGQVENVQIPGSPSSKFRLKLQIKEELHGLVRTDSVATIGSEGVVGDTFLSIQPGSPAAPPIQANGVLQSKEPTAIADLLNQAKGTILDVDTAVKNANGLLSSVGGNLNATLTTAHSTIADADAVIDGLKRGRGTAGMLLQDQKAAETVRHALENTQQATKNLQDTTAKADALLTDVGSRDFPRKIDDVLASARSASAALDQASAGIQSTIAPLTISDENGNTTGENLRQAISRVNSATGNMAEDTEALKHNFLLRRFFRSRGYYSLTGISPTSYHKDPVFSRARGPRLWLAGDQIFSRDLGKQAELTPEGKALIDQALGHYGDSLEGTPIIIEGYDASGSALDKMDISRQRAVAVRAYLIERYHLESINLGTVGLSDLPPRGTSRSSWDGVCIALLRPEH